MNKKFIFFYLLIFSNCGFTIKDTCEFMFCRIKLKAKDKCLVLFLKKNSKIQKCRIKKTRPSCVTDIQCRTEEGEDVLSLYIPRYTLTQFRRKLLRSFTFSDPSSTFLIGEKIKIFILNFGPQDIRNICKQIPPPPPPSSYHTSNCRLKNPFPLS